MWLLVHSTTSTAATISPEQADAQERALFNVAGYCDGSVGKSLDAEPVACFVASTKQALVACAMLAQLKLEGYQLESERRRLQPGEFGSVQKPLQLTCIDASLATADVPYRKALAATAKQKAKNGLAKDYYAAWRVAIEGLRPATLSETKLAYNVRQNASIKAVSERGERLKLE